MNRASDRSNSAASTRRGFTLLELMIVVVIIAILLGLLLVALRGPQSTARIAQVRTELAGFETALNDFKATFGEYPPSRITLYETGTDWPGANAEKVRSRAILRQYWPMINFNVNRDFNLDGDTDDTIELKGPECLVFFLGGMARFNDTNGNSAADPGEISVIGFSKNPSDPFSLSGTNRKGPFAEFQASRLVASGRSGLGNLPVYLDPLPGNQNQPILYASAYDGRGYQTVDINNWMTGGPYTQTGGSYWNPKSFQLISPGFDHLYGTGGAFVAETANDDLTGTRADERDNITNFHNSVLAPN